MTRQVDDKNNTDDVENPFNELSIEERLEFDEETC